ncbi:hypothetical protein E6R60_15720 [Streptomyces sp. A0642]|nr:hypothetical protein E6R60_15720 [Streptomyces sp. A0642]
MPLIDRCQAARCANSFTGPGHLPIRQAERPSLVKGLDAGKSGAAASTRKRGRSRGTSSAAILPVKPPTETRSRTSTSPGCRSRT